jgi:hypothetical protein
MSTGKHHEFTPYVDNRLYHGYAFDNEGRMKYTMMIITLNLE